MPLESTIDPSKKAQLLNQLARDLFGASNSQGAMQHGPTRRSELWFDDSRNETKYSDAMNYEPQGAERVQMRTPTSQHSSYIEIMPTDPRLFTKEALIQFPELVKFLYPDL